MHGYCLFLGECGRLLRVDICFGFYALAGWWWLCLRCDFCGFCLMVGLLSVVFVVFGVLF